jgi:hypothetical protein
MAIGIWPQVRNRVGLSALQVAAQGAGLVVEGAVVAGAGDCAAPGEPAEVEPHPTRPTGLAAAASLAYRMNADIALTSSQRTTYLLVLRLRGAGRGHGPTTRFPRLWSPPPAGLAAALISWASTSPSRRIMTCHDTSLGAVPIRDGERPRSGPRIADTRTWPMSVRRLVGSSSRSSPPASRRQPATASANPRERPFSGARSGSTPENLASQIVPATELTLENGRLTGTASSRDNRERKT